MRPRGYPPAPASGISPTSPGVHVFDSESFPGNGSESLTAPAAPGRISLSSARPA